MKKIHPEDFFNLDEIENLTVSLDKLLKQGETLCSILHISDERLESLYLKGFELYERQDYRKSRKLFALLTLFSPDVPKYWWALGAVQVATHEYRAALNTYAVLIVLEPHNPQPHFFSCYCRQQLGEPKEAMEAMKQGREILSAFEKSKKEAHS